MERQRSRDKWQREIGSRDKERNVKREMGFGEVNEEKSRIRRWERGIGRQVCGHANNLEAKTELERWDRTSKGVERG